MVPVEYHDLAEVFSKAHALSLPHQPDDGCIDLLLEVPLPSGRLYQLSRSEQGEVRDRLVDHRTSSSAIGAGFFFVQMNDGSLWPCNDYQSLNYIAVKNRYPLPLLDVAFSLLHKAQFFTKLDLRSAYHLVWIRQGMSGKLLLTHPLDTSNIQ